MKKIKQLTLTLPLLTALLSPLSAQTVYTDPVGAVVVNIPDGTSVLSVPFQKPAILQSNVSSVTGNTITLSSTIPVLPNPSYIQVISGTNNGAIASIDSSTTTTIDIGQSGIVNQGDLVIIREHFTLTDFGDLPDFTTLTLYNSDGTTFTANYIFGSWDQPESTTIYPGEGFVLNSGAPVIKTWTGSVAVKPINFNLNPGIVNIVGSLNPVEIAGGVETLFSGLPDFSSVTFYQMGDLTTATTANQVFGWDMDVTLVSTASPRAFVVIPSSSLSLTIGHHQN